MTHGCETDRAPGRDRGDLHVLARLRARVDVRTIREQGHAAARRRSP